MVTVVNYKVRRGNPVSSLCEDGSPVYIFTFGTETQEIISCLKETEVLTTLDMCLLGGDYFAASYKAHPGKVNDRFVFSSNIQSPVIRSGSYPGDSFGGGGNFSGDF